MRGAYQAGVLAALHEAGVWFAHVDATSAGVMNLAMLLSGLTPEQMCERWRSLSARDWGAPTPALPARLGVDVARVNAATGRVGTFNVGNLSTRGILSVPHQELSDELLLAAVSPPGLVPAVSLAGVDYADAAWIQNANLFEAVRRGAEEIWLVWCLGDASRYRAGVLPSHDQLLELAASGGLSATFRYLAQLNERIVGGDSPYGQRCAVRFKWIRPEHPLPRDVGEGAVGGTTLVHLGYADAWRRLREREADDPLDVAASRVESSESAVALDERFAGFLTAEGELAGHEQLEDGGLRIELALSVFVHEVETFIAEGRRAAPLAGTIHYAGASLGLRHGLVRRQPEPEAALLLYEAYFQPRSAARPLRLRLTRRLPGAGPARLEDVTVLEASIYDGVEPGAQRVAHGRLETSVEELTASCRTLHPLEPASPEQSARAIVQLGRFLFGELYDAYTGRPWWKVW